MDQEKIWEHFQNEGVSSFGQNQGRLAYLVRQLTPGKRVLNIGVGNGLLERLALARGVEIWSLDPGDRAIARLRAELDLGERAQVGYSQALPFAEGHFDAVVMSEVLEHLDEETLLATLAEVRRVLRPGGIFIGTVPARERLEDSLVICPCCGVSFHRWGHKRSYSVGSLRELLAARFTVDAMYEIFFIEWDGAGWGRRLAGLIKKFLSWRGIGTYGVCRNIYFAVRKSA